MVCDLLNCMLINTLGGSTKHTITTFNIVTVREIGISATLSITVLGAVMLSVVAPYDYFLLPKPSVCKEELK